MDGSHAAIENDARRAIAGFYDKTLSGPALMRALATSTWQVPGRPAPPGESTFKRIPLNPGEAHLCLFSDAEALRAARLESGDDAFGRDFVEAPGAAVFAQAEADVHYVQLNPHSEQALHFKPEQFEMLRRWSEILGMERLIDEVVHKPHGYGRLKGFEGYTVLLRQENGRTRIAMAPDTKGRALVAVFTAPDAVDAFITQHGAQAGEPLLIGGADLFERFAAMPIDGFVFNCAGPLPPRAFARQFARIVVERG